MRIEETPVKREGTVVATLAVPQYETLDEAIEAHGAERVLSDFNRQHKTDLSNRARVAAAEQSIEAQIAKVAKQKRKGEITAADAKRQLADLMAQLDDETVEE